MTASLRGILIFRIVTKDSCYIYSLLDLEFPDRPVEATAEAVDWIDQSRSH